MKQVVQSYDNGDLRLQDVPVPVCRSGGVLVRTAFSLVSAGTERMKVGQARMGLMAKARARPDKVRQVLQSVRQVGVLETCQKVRERLSALTPLGYSLAGIVEEVGPGIDEFRPGDRVACAGEGIACHAEFVWVPRNLCALVPEGADLKDAAFATVGAIAMNGVRQAGVTIGDNVLVVGLGLVGLLGVQILKAAGCRVVGVDVDAQKLETARACGADVALSLDDPALEENIRHVTGGLGPDVAYLAASTSSSAPMKLAGDVVRDRGRVVIVGMLKIQADWQTYYAKELSVVLSRSYGPGRYDRNFEQKGIDYPIGYVRWTQRRNLEEFLRLTATGALHPGLLKPRFFRFDQAPEAYQQLHEGRLGRSAALVFQYPQDAPLQRRIAAAGRIVPSPRSPGRPVGIGFIGAGNFATGTLIPALRRLPQARLVGICSAAGLSATGAALRHGFEYAASDYREILADNRIEAVIVATRHETHARFSADALQAGKHVYVEKPLALTGRQLHDLVAARASAPGLLVPGFNRRFSPLSVAVRDFFASRRGPVEVLCRVNAGSLKSDSWYQDPEEGGWRIISEGCHFIDLIQFICGCEPERVFAEMIGGGIRGAQNDNCVVTLRMEDGSLGVLTYLANGDPAYAKELIEVFGQGRTAVIDNFHVARLWSEGKCRSVRPHGTGKGHMNALAAFLAAIRGDPVETVPFESAIATTQATFQAARSLACGRPLLLHEVIEDLSDGLPGDA